MTPWGLPRRRDNTNRTIRTNAHPLARRRDFSLAAALVAHLLYHVAASLKSQAVNDDSERAASLAH